MIEEVIKEMDVPASKNVAHQLDPQVTALRADVVEDLLIDSNVRTRISNSVTAAMTSGLGLSLC